MFKDPSAFKTKSDRICYIAENDAYTEGYTYSDFLDIAKGSEDVAVSLFYQSPAEDPVLFRAGINAGLTILKYRSLEILFPNWYN